MVIAANASAAERGLQLTDYGYRPRIHEFAEKAKLAINVPYLELKQLLINPNIWGEEVARIAQGPGYDHVTESPYVIYMRICAHLANFDAETERHTKEFYHRECDTNIAVYISDESTCHDILLGQAMHVTDRQRYEFMRIQFVHKTGGQLAVRDFDVQHPLPAEKNLVNLHIWMLHQSPNIMVSVSREPAVLLEAWVGHSLRHQVLRQG
jgi:hypothetical protein